MKKIIAFLTAAAIFFDLFTPLRLYVSGGKALMLLLPTIIIIMYDKLFARWNFWPMALYVGGAVGTMLLGSLYYTLPTLLTVVFAYACIEHYMVTRDAFYAKIVGVTLYATMLVMVAISLPLFISIPNLSRLMNDAEENGIMTPLFYWTLSYSDIHSLPIYSIFVFYMYRNATRKIVRIFSFAFIVAIFVLMLFADSTGALLINIAIFGILLLYNQKKSLRTNISRFMVLGVGMLALLNKTVVVGVLYTVRPLFAGSSTYVKIGEMAEMIGGQGSSGDIEAREDKFEMSWKSFVEEPLLPTIEDQAFAKIGHHNVLFDQIVALGLFFGLFFIWFLIDRIKRPLKYLTATAKPYYLVGILAFLVMGFMKNYLLLLPACTILPMILIAVENPNRRFKVIKNEFISIVAEDY